MKIKRILSLTISAIISVTLLAGCEKAESVAEETTVSETTAKYSDEELELMAQDMPEIPFVLAYEKEGDNIFGCYVMNTGEVKLFDFRTIAPDEVYDVRDVYDRLEEATCDRLEPVPSMNYEERLITEDELAKITYDEVIEYYKILLSIEGDAEYIEWDYSFEYNGSYLFYGIKANDQNEEECILLRGFGAESEYLHNNSDARLLYAAFLRFLPNLRDNVSA